MTEEAYTRARAGQAELDRHASQFPDHDITCEVTVDRVRFVARGRSLSARPSLVMTGDLDELYAELAAGREAVSS
ncbi:MAG: hypothetical protein ABJB47_18210 [Actinomycetota bacterium]